MSKFDELQNGLEELSESLYEVIAKANELYSISKEYRCFGGQLKEYFISTLDSLANNYNQPGSIVNLQGMLYDNEDGYEGYKDE